MKNIYHLMLISCATCTRRSERCSTENIFFINPPSEASGGGLIRRNNEPVTFYQTLVHFYNLQVIGDEWNI